MISWTFVLLCVSSQIYASSEVRYECGPHGKFEYCIDGIPGCVVGCHCHPGYYFDTDTKICEPNMKLTQFRRRYDLEPTRIPIMNLETESIPSTINPIDEKVDEIAKDADDLGDWLYNQFFKTIENQVINNTNGETPTRRSGSSPMKPKRRARKKNKKSKKKHKKKGLKKKLLRITEDDSLFDSSSSSSSDETDSSSSESESESSDEHDHRKILMINKKPTPPLPSFIFLPNVETPFYPPISLPAPPIVPMYPMVPVPPMGVMYQGDSTTTSSCATLASIATTATTAPEVSSTTKIATSTPSTAETPGNTESTPNPETPDVTEAENPSTDSVRAGLRSRLDKFLPNDAKKNMHRNKLMQKFRENMKRKNKRPSIRNLMENFQHPENPYPEELEQSFELRQRTLNDMPKLEDVDFKYLSQLIHRIDLNKTMPNLPYNPIVNHPNSAAEPLRRNNYQSNMPQTYFNPSHTRPASKADDITDTYYTDLGKQIASLIRKLDSNGERQIDIEIQQQNPQNQQTIFNENRFAPRSYWERFVRSPLKYFRQFIMDHQKHSNENLIDIENQVNMATTAERSLSLQELENIANIMQQTHTKQQNKKKKTSNPTQRIPQFHNNLNINLLPPAVRRKALTRTVEKKNNYNINKIKKNTERNGNTLTNYDIFRKQNIPRQYDMKNHTSSDQKNLTKTFMRDIIKINPLGNILKTQHISSLYNEASDVVYKNVTKPKLIRAEQTMKYQLNPVMLNYKSINYVSNNRNKYHVQRSYIPFNVPYFSKQKPAGKSRNPSYFHHELHHFDFFD